MRIIALALILSATAACTSVPPKRNIGLLGISGNNGRAACEAAGKAAREQVSLTGPVVRALDTVEPTYPISERQRAIQGCVELMFDLNESGEQNNIRVIATQPKNANFREAALEAFALWQFPKTPAKNQTATIEFNWELEYLKKKEIRLESK